MAWRIVKQPNGKLARFSDIVDNFTHMDMTFNEAVEVCEMHMGKSDAREKVMRGVDDDPIDPGVPRAATDKLERWRASIETIRLIHGGAEARKRESEGYAANPD